MAEKFTELDFHKVKENIRDYLKSQSTFMDYDFSGAALNVLLDVLAYNTLYNNTYTNFAFAEMFLDSAQLRDSVVSRAKELNYVPRSVTSSFGVVQVEVLNVEGLPAFLTLPKYSKFIGRANNETFTFTTNQTYAIDASSGSYCSGDIAIYEGIIATEGFEVKDGRQRFILSNPNIDTTSLELRVRDTVEPDSEVTDFLLKDNLFGVERDDPVFYLNEADKGRYEVSFGKDIFGREPIVGNVIEVTYRVASGSAPNGIKNYTFNGTVEGYQVKVTSMAKSVGGADREDIESIRYFAPKALQVQDRAVVANDYKVLLKNKFPEITALSVYGGEELNPPQFGRTVVSLAVNDMDGFSENVRNRCLEFLQDRSVLGIEPIILSPEYMYISVDTDVKFDRSRTAEGAGTIRNHVYSTIRNFSKNNLSDFGETLYLSKLIAEIDNSFEHIISNETSVRAIISFEPFIRTQSKYELYFQNRLKINRRIAAGDDISDYSPTVRTTPFQIDELDGYVMDDGNGILHFVRNVNNTFTYVKKAVGSVEYDTGKITLNKVNITDFEGSGIEFQVLPRDADIRSPKSRIIRIRDEDIDITVNGVYGD